MLVYGVAPPTKGCPYCPPLAAPTAPYCHAGGEALDFILAEALGMSPEGGEGGEGGQQLGFGQKVGLTLSSLQRFMRSLSN